MGQNQHLLPVRDAFEHARIQIEQAICHLRPCAVRDQLLVPVPEDFLILHTLGRGTKSARKGPICEILCQLPQLHRLSRVASRGSRLRKGV